MYKTRLYFYHDYFPKETYKEILFSIKYILLGVKTIIHNVFGRFAIIASQVHCTSSFAMIGQMMSVKGMKRYKLLF